MKSKNPVKRWLSWLLCVSMLLSANGYVLVGAVGTETDAPAVTVTQTVMTDADQTDERTATPTLRDYSIPSSSTHAYDPFAQLKDEEATAAYRESVQYEAGTIIFKVTESAVVDGDLTAVGIDLDAAQELNRTTVDGTDEVTYVAPLDGDVWETVDALSETAGVVDAQPNYLYEDTAIDVPTITKNPHADKQWYHGPDHLNCDKHWQHMHDDGITAGEGSIVAVIDTGVDYTHPDLAANMWVNTAELNGTAGVDDDGNGYVDDVYGCSTVGASRYHSGDPMDDHGHGTHVAGIIGMTANNDEGAVGLAYGTKIMAIKAGQATGVFSDADIAEAIRYAYTMGADVINMSFGGTGRSFLVEEALAEAFSSCVLVAAAGNDGLPTADAPDDFMKKADFYPAGYSYVLGVMASDQNGNLASFSNWDYYNNGGSAEYEMTAPGVDIYSTLPGGQYAQWDGTSMAAPLVSAAAALIRSKYNDKATYSSRFIMGQLASATDRTLLYVDKIGMGHDYTMLDLEASLNELPEPNLTVKNTYLFDDPAIDPANDGDGVVDAGETIDLAVVVRNQWGMAEAVTVTADALSDGGVANPYIEWIIDTVALDDVGTFNEVTNGFVYENDALVGVSNPLRFKVRADCINDAHIAFNLTVTCRNALDAEDTATYKAEGGLSFYVQRGRTVSGTITEDMVWTAEDYWIVENAVYIPEGVTVTVQPGTQIQFWGNDASDPYAARYMAYIEVDGAFLVQGTAEAPVEMFPSAAYQDYGVDIRGGVRENTAANPLSTTVGDTRLSYVNILNPRLNFNHGDHLFITQNREDIYYRSLSNGTVSRHTNYRGKLIANTVNASLLQGCNFENFFGRYTNTLFDRCRVDGTLVHHLYSYKIFQGCAFRGADPFKGRGATLQNPMPFEIPQGTYTDVFTFGDSKYVILKGVDTNWFAEAMYAQKEDSSSALPPYYFRFHALNALAAVRGGSLATLDSAEETAFLQEMVKARSGGHNTAYNHLTETGSVGIITYYGSLSTTDSYRLLLFEYPATVADEEILRPFTAAETAVAAQAAMPYAEYLVPSFQNNAVLNEFLSGETSGWTTLSTSMDTTYVSMAQNNYWGTENEQLIQAQIIDQDTYASLSDIVTEPYLTPDSPELETIYPFVTEAYITDAEGNRLTTCGYEEIQVHVTFNRDMDTAVLPTVSFGPAAPYTDYVVEGAFVDARHWVGTTTVRSVIDAGTEYIRVKDAAAANDTWLRTGVDEARFAFTVASTGAEALTLQAVGGEDCVELSWTQDDYATLAGFNVYRATAENGTYQKLNTRLIPGTIREYTDTDVQPGVEYFYYFTVMGTDLVESNPSNTAAATPIDNVKPVLNHSRVTAANYGESITFNATATDNIGVDYVTLFYRAAGETAYKSVDMTLIENNRYYAAIEGREVAAAGMEYYIEVSDGVSVVRDGSAQYPIAIAVDSSMALYGVSPAKVDVTAAGTTTAVLTGVNLSDTMTLTVGGKAVEYTFVSSNQVSFTVPTGSLGRVDIEVTDGARTASLRNALTYTESTAEVQIVAPNEVKARETVRLPIFVNASGAVYGVDLQLKITRSLYSSVKFEKSAANAAAAVSFSAPYSGVVKLSMASATVLDTTEPIGYLVLTPNNVTESTSTAVEITAAQLNAVAIHSLIDCQPVILPNFTVSGKITYYNSTEGIAGVKVTLSNGMVTYTDENGAYTFTGVTTSRVTVTPSFTGAVNGAVSAQDAALLLQAITGEGEALTEMQQLAADVDGDGKFTALDASYILRKSVGEFAGAFPGSGAEWVFSQPVQVLTLTADKNNVNFTGVLLGDVSGDWTAKPESELE